MLQRNLIYTGVTRGKRLVLLVSGPWRTPTCTAFAACWHAQTSLPGDRGNHDPPVDETSVRSEFRQSSRIKSGM
jgi:hypothetical protein